MSQNKLVIGVFPTLNLRIITPMVQGAICPKAIVFDRPGKLVCLFLNRFVRSLSSKTSAQPAPTSPLSDMRSSNPLPIQINTNLFPHHHQLEGYAAPENVWCVNPLLAEQSHYPLIVWITKQIQRILVHAQQAKHQKKLFQLVEVVPTLNYLTLQSFCHSHKIKLHPRRHSQHDLDPEWTQKQAPQR